LEDYGTFIFVQEKDSKLEHTIEAAITGEAQGNSYWFTNTTTKHSKHLQLQ